jgi:hypothetical protein
LNDESKFASNYSKDLTARVSAPGFTRENSTSKAFVEVLKYEFFDRTFILIIIFCIIWQLPKEKYAHQGKILNDNNKIALWILLASSVGTIS